MAMTLPPSIRPYWTTLTADKAAAPEHRTWEWNPDPFAAKKEVESRQTKRKEKEEKVASGAATPNGRSNGAGGSGGGGSGPGGRFWEGVPEVRMAPALRETVEAVVRKVRSITAHCRQLTDDQMMQQFPSVVLDATRDLQGPSSGQASGAATPSLDIASLTTQLTTLGFRPAHITSVLTAISAASARLNSTSSASSDPLVLSLTILSPLEAAIEWLLLHLPEDDLPHRYRTSASSADFVVGASRQGGLVKGWLADKLVKQAGFPRKAVETVLQAEGVSEGSALEVLGRKLCGWQGEDQGWGSGEAIPWSGDNDLAAERDLSREEEEMAIEAVMGERYSTTTEGGKEISIEIGDEDSGEKVNLRIILDQSSPYPSSQYPTRPPPFYLDSTSVPAYMRLHLQASLLRQFRDADRGDLRSILESGQGGAILSMVEYLEQALPDVLANPPDIGAVTDHLIPRLEEISAKSETVRRVAKKPTHGVRKRVIREEDHERARQTQKRMKEDMKWSAMLADREKLPAWKERNNIVDALESNRVLVVVGEVSRLASKWKTNSLADWLW